MRHDKSWEIVNRWLVILLAAFVVMLITVSLTRLYMASVDAGGYYDPKKAKRAMDYRPRD